jgi:D-alanyl-D-alanine dipeptidase
MPSRLAGWIVLLVASTSMADQAPPGSLVPIETVRPPLLQEVRYATRHNFTGRVLYPLPRVFLHRDTARALQRVQRDLQKSGLGLKVWDAYRPMSVQEKMWDLIRDERYVSNPAKNKGRHTRGTAVDVTLIDKLGRELPMPSDFDDFSERAHREYRGGTATQRRNRQILQDAMAQHGFVPFPTEWWHFDLNNWENYPPLDASIEHLASMEKPRSSRGQIDHLVVVWLKRPGNKGDIDRLIRATRELTARNGLIRCVRYGGPLPSERPVVDDTFDLAILMRFDDRHALADFEKDPDHRRAIAEVLQPAARRVLIYDVALK